MNMKKLASLLLAMVLVLAMAVPAMATEVATGKGGNASITIANASKGITYKVYKLFDASVTGDNDGSIVYTGTIPDSLTIYFTEVNGYIVATDAAKNTSGDLSAEAIAAMTEWAKTATVTATGEGQGDALVFTGLEYGYYVITTTQGTAISVDSTNPNVTIYDKNSTEPDITKSVNDADVDIGQTVTYTATATTSNYLGEGSAAKKVTKYEITDTLPEFLKDVKVTSITIGGAAYTVNGEVPQFANVDDDAELEIIIPWVNADGDSLYANGAEIVVTYTATVTDKAVVDGTTGNINVVTLKAYVEDGDDEDDKDDPWDKTWSDDEVIFTYAGALQKVDENKKPLAGAKFAALGLTVEKVSDGVYRVVSYDPTSTVYGNEMETDAQGQLVILGLSSDSKLTVKETVAPAGYNILVNTTTITPVKTGEEIKATAQTIYYDANGNVTATETSTKYEKTTYNVNLLKTAIVVVNQAGTELPETGGMGTTMLYVGGGILVLGAVILLITRKRMTAK